MIYYSGGYDVWWSIPSGWGIVNKNITSFVKLLNHINEV